METTKKSFVETVSIATGFKSSDVSMVLNAMIKATSIDLEEFGEARIPGLVAFKISEGKVRNVSNPMTAKMRVGTITVRPSIHARALHSIKNSVKR